MDADCGGSARSGPQSVAEQRVSLDPLDHLLAAHGFQMVRYADDFVVLCRSAEQATQALEQIRNWVAENGLTLHPTKTRLVDACQEGFDFLGYHFERDQHWPRQKSVQKLRDSLRAKTRRTSGRSLDRTIADVNRTLRGWFASFDAVEVPTLPAQHPSLSR